MEISGFYQVGHDGSGRDDLTSHSTKTEARDYFSPAPVLAYHHYFETGDQNGGWVMIFPGFLEAQHTIVLVGF